VIFLLRLIGIINAAVWFGAAVFFMLVAAPALFSPEMKTLLGRPHAGAAAQIVVDRYFILNQVCGVIALLHLVTDWLYTGKPLQRYLLGLVGGLLALGLLGGQWLEPKLKGLHREMFVAGNSFTREPVTPRQKEAEKSFKLWHGVAQGLNLIAMGGLLVYLWRATDPTHAPRFFSANKFRG
jgi:hypothetical protein